MEYVNKSTGEILETEEISLANINKSELNVLFCTELRKLTKELPIRGGVGSINICIKAEVAADPTGDITVYLESSIGTKYPKQKLGESTNAKIASDGTLVQCRQADMFAKKDK